MRGVNRLTGICAGGVAALALGLAGAPGASAAAGLVLKTTSGPLAGGAPITATSTNAVLSTSGGGSVECEESTLSGTLANNGAKTDGMSVANAAFAGDYQSMLGACKFSLGGTAITEAQHLPWKLEIGGKEAFLTGNVRLSVSFPQTLPEVTCVYEGKKDAAAVLLGAQLTVEFNNAPSVLVEGAPESCPANGGLTATFTFTSGGKQVEAVIGSEFIEPGGSLSGTVENEAAQGVENVTVEACEEEGEEAEICVSTQSGTGGNYSFPTLPAGFYVLIAKPPALSGYSTTRSQEFEVLSNASPTQNIVLRGSGSVQGEISSEANSPLSGVQVSLCEQVQDPHCLTTTTDGSGNYSFAQAPAGSYKVAAAPGLGSGYARLSSSAFAVVGNQTATENLKLPEAGTVTGVVTNQQSAPVADEIVDVCLQESCYQGTTDGLGSYTIQGVADGQDSAIVAASGQYGSAVSGPFTVSGTATTTVNLTVGEPVGPRAGTEMPNTEVIGLGNAQVPLFYWNNEAELDTTGCVGGHVTATATGINTQTLELQTSPPATLAEHPSASGKFDGKLPKLYPVHGFLTVAIKIEGCPQPSEEETTEFNAYVDPSGAVVDGNHADAPVSGATVTLLAGPEGFGPFTAVPNGSTVMSPSNRKNPDTTSSAGEFGWDTLPGWYEVQAHKAGCGTTTTPAFQVPPPVDNLQLVLHCSPVLIETSSLPTDKREASYETQLVAGGEAPPFKWKKKGKLPKGLKLSKSGVLSGTIKRKKVPLGTYSIQVEVKDAAHHTATVTLPLKVR